jgi:hypothetical protein
MAPLCDLSQVNIQDEKDFKLKWTDQAGLKPLTEENADEDDLVNLQNPPPIMNHRQQRMVKPIVKGSKAKLQ